MSILNPKQFRFCLLYTSTHDSNAASFCKRILFIQDGVIFHELRRGDESQQEFYGRILKVMAQLGGGSANVDVYKRQEYTYLTQGKRIDGTMYSCTSLGVKIGGGIGTAVVGWMRCV